MSRRSPHGTQNDDDEAPGSRLAAVCGLRRSVWGRRKFAKVRRDFPCHRLFLWCIGPGSISVIRLERLVESSEVGQDTLRFVAYTRNTETLNPSPPSLCVWAAVVKAERNPYYRGLQNYLYYFGGFRSIIIV